MNRVKRLLSFMLLLAVMVNMLPINIVWADEVINTGYSELFDTDAAAYFVTCQPSDAIILNSSVTLDTDMLCTNYRGGIVDLPRLQIGYYYTVSGQFYLPDTMYPTLAWYEAAQGTSASLSIRSQDTNKTMMTIQIVCPKDSLLHGTDYWYPEEDSTEVADIKSADAKKPWASDGVWKGRPVTAKKFVDCSDPVVRDLVSAGDAMTRWSKRLAFYDPELHRSAIVMDAYVYTPDNSDATGDFVGATSESCNFDSMCYEMSKYTPTTEGISLTTQVKDFIGTLNNGVSRPGLLFYGSKTEDCQFNPTTGVSATKILPTDTDILYSFIATSNNCFFYKMDMAVTEDELKETSGTAPRMQWESNIQYNLHPLVPYQDAGFETSTVNPMTYGPLNFTRCIKNAGDKFIMSGKYKVTHTNMTEQDDLNLYGESLIYPGAVPHFATVNVKAATNQITINYYVKQPNTDNFVKLFDAPKLYNAAVFADQELESLPKIENYKENCWYVDQKLTTKFDQKTVAKDQNRTMSLYGEYKWIGGMYSVQFYDERTKLDKTFSMPANKMPTFPATPTDSTGWFFKEWMLVNSVSDSEGITFDPVTFTPVANSTYILKAKWTNKGGIVKIETTKNDYVIGEKLDTSTIKITVRDDNGEHIASASEFTVDKVDLKEAGTTTITVKLTASGVTGIFTVNVADITPTSIAASYKGSSVYVGQEVNPNNFEVMVYYNNGSSAKTDEFTLSPAVVLAEGLNSIDVWYMDQKATCTVVGIPFEDDDDDEYNEEDLTEIKAEYLNDFMYMTDELLPQDVMVTAIYSDGTEITLAPEVFTISPTTFTTPGKNQSTATYGGLSAAFEVNVRSKSAAGTNAVGNYLVVNDGHDSTVASKYPSSGLYGSLIEIPKTSGTGSGSSKPSKDKDKNGNKKPSSNGSSSTKTDTTTTVEKRPDGTTITTTKKHTESSSKTGTSTHNDALKGQKPGGSTTSSSDPKETPAMGNNGNNGTTGNGNDNAGDNEDVNGGESQPNDGAGVGSGDGSSTSNPFNQDSVTSSKASVGYLDGATILTNTMGLTGLQTVNVDIMSVLKGAKKNSDVYLELPNGSTGNVLTSDMLSTLKKRNLTLHLNMVKPTDTSTVLAQWTIIGRKIDTSTTALNPNVTFEVTDKSTDRLVYFAIANQTYPLGCTLTIIPDATCYNSGELCRLYGCDINKGNTTLVSTVVWQDGKNQFTYDVYGGHSYCLSNSATAYSNGGSLLDANGLTSSFEEPTEPTDEPNTTVDDPTEQVEPSTTGGFNVLFIIIPLVVIMIICGVIFIILKRRK